MGVIQKQTSKSGPVGRDRLENTLNSAAISIICVLEWILLKNLKSLIWK